MAAGPDRQTGRGPGSPERFVMMQVFSYQEALDLVLESVTTLAPMPVPVEDAHNAVLAADARALHPIPPFCNSAMDGFALRAVETAAASPDRPGRFRILEDVAAGSLPRLSIEPGTASRIMTGAPIPEGADAVAVVEKTRVLGKELEVLYQLAPGDNIREIGEDIGLDELVIRSGTRLGPAEVGMLAAMGYPRPMVIPPPRVAIFTSGDELLGPDDELVPGKIRDANNLSLATSVVTCGARPLILGVARDTEQDLERIIRRALEEADVVVSSAGVSMGELDLVKKVLRKLEVELRFERVAMRPGRPNTFGCRGKVPVFGLPGNPVSALVSFEQFVRPALMKMAGMVRWRRPVVYAGLARPVKKPRQLRFFERVRLSNPGREVLASSTGAQGSGILSSMVKADGLAVIPEGREVMEAGELVEVQILRPEYEWGG